MFQRLWNRESRWEPFHRATIVHPESTAKGLAYTGVAMYPAAGTLWDTKRPTAAQAQLGYFAKILAKMPHANDFITDAFGDGLNYADHKYLLVRHGNNDNQSIVGSEGQAERKQINIKIDQNFCACAQTQRRLDLSARR